MIYYEDHKVKFGLWDKGIRKKWLSNEDLEALNTNTIYNNIKDKL